MKARLRRWLPDADKVRGNRWLKWLGPTLQHPRLWHISRKGIALGFAVGIFFGLLIPIAQIPASAAVAVVLRANLPMAVASTLVTNPLTFGPIYYVAYRIGGFVLGEEEVTSAEAQAAIEHIKSEPEETHGLIDRFKTWLTHLGSIGKPLMVGLAILATVSAVSVYFLISGLWIMKTRLARKRRRRK